MVVQNPTAILEVVGDSIPALNTPGGVPNVWTQSAAADLASRFPNSNIVLSNRALPGTTTTTIWNTQVPLTVGNTPAQRVTKMCLWFAWSPNDGITATDINTAYDTFQAQFLALCATKGFVPVLGTNIPCNGIASATDDSARQTNNDKVRATPAAIIADFDAVMSDHLPRANIVAAYTPDGTHVTTAPGEAAMWPPLSNAIAAYLTSIGMT